MPKNFYGVFALIVVVTFSPSRSLARTWFVEADGSGDVPTIQAAVDLAATFDVIELGDGVFVGPGNRDVNAGSKALTFRSRSNVPEDCVIDCEGTAEESHRGFTIQQKCDFRGLTIRNGHTDAQGGAIFSIAGEGVAIYDCVFIDNTAVSGGAMWIEANTRTPAGIEVQNSTFLRNHAEGAGAVYAAFFFVEFVECQFIDNTAVDHGGGVFFARSVVEFTRCLFVGNQASEGGAVCCHQWDATMWWCTFVGNQAYAVGGGAHVDSNDPKGGVTLRNCILAFGAGGGAVSCEYDFNVRPICCDIFGNEGGDWVECLQFHVGQDANISLDPLFCDASAYDYSLSANSPCAAENNPACGLIGTFDVGCGPTATETRSWGVIKSLYR